MARVGVVLAGCGVFDGTEIHEAVSAMLALTQAGAEYQCMAPNTPQMHVVDHIKGKPMPGESRNALIEAARIARGKIVPLSEVKAADYDAFVFPGGFGAAKNLCTFAIEGDACSVHPEVTRLITEAHAARKTMCFICIAPVIAAKVLGKATHLKLTIGDDNETAQAITAMGAVHVACAVENAVVDHDHKVVSTPAYMLAQNIAEVYTGIGFAIQQTLKLV